MLTLPDAEPIASILHNASQQRITINTVGSIASGPTSALTEWGATVDGGGPVLPTSIVLSGGNIRLQSAAWGVGTTVSNLVYVPGPTPWVSDDGKELQGFNLPVPYP